MKYLVMYSTGKYDDYYSTPYVVYDEEEGAKNLAQELNTRLKMFGLHVEQEDSPASWRHRFDDMDDAEAAFMENLGVTKTFGFDYNGGKFWTTKVFDEWDER